MSETAVPRPLAHARLLLDVADAACRDWLRRAGEAAGATVFVGGGDGAAGSAPLLLCQEPGAAEIFVLRGGQLCRTLPWPLAEADFVSAIAALAGAARAVATEGAAPLDLARLGEWVGDDAAALRQVVVDFLRINGAFLAELEAAAARNDAGATRLMAHRLKGSAGMIGAAPLARASLALEEAATGAPAELAGRCAAVRGEYDQLERYLRERYAIAPAELV